MTGKRKSRSFNVKPTEGKSANENKRPPTYRNMIKAAIISQKQPRGSSRQSILKYICSNYNIKDKNKANRYLKQALKTGVKTGFLIDATGKRTTEYFKVADDTTKERRRSTKRTEAIKKPNSLTSGSKPVNACQKGVRTNSAKTRQVKSTKRTVNKQSSQSTCKTKSKASQKVRNDIAAKPRKDKGALSRLSSSSVHVTKAANQNIRKAGNKTSKSSKKALSVDRLASETTGIEDTTHQSTPLSYIRATLIEASDFPLLSPIKKPVIAEDGKIIILEANTNNIRLYSSDMKHLSYLRLKDKPVDISIYSENQALVTTGYLIYFIDFSNDFLSVMYTFFSTDYFVCGITACQENIYVTCRNGNWSLKMIDSSGNIYWRVSIDRKGNESEGRPLGITSFTIGTPLGQFRESDSRNWPSVLRLTSFSDDGHVRLVATDDYENTIKMLDGESGELLATHFTRGFGVCSPITDKCNNIYVCYPESGFVSVLTSNLSHDRALIASKTSQRITIFPPSNTCALPSYPRKMAYNRNSNHLIIFFDNGKIQIYQLHQSKD